MDPEKKNGPTGSMQERYEKQGQDAWELMWQDKVTPWNMGKPAPPLVSLIKDDYPLKIPIPKQCIVVPGCGEGLDCLFLAEQFPQCRVLGIDLSHTAVEHCRQHAQSKLLPNLSFEVADFFETSTLQPGSVDFLFDYTFLCALKPDPFREMWSRRMAELLAPGGILVTLMFPLGEESYEGGPPFYLTVEIYEALLLTRFEPLCAPTECRESAPQRRHRELVRVWKKRQL